MNRLARRDFLKTSSALAAASLLPGCAMEPAAPSRPIGRVIVIGGGFGGATAAKYLRMWSEGTIEVFLIERNAEFISCPTSNLVLGGTRTLADITRSYAKLREYGVQVLRDEATAVNVEKKRVSLKRIEDLPYDRLIVSPAVDFMHEAIEGYDAEAQKTILHAWKAGPETVALRQQLEAMPDGGVCVIGVPRSPFRCPPGPYERACQIASYFKKAKPRSKVIVLDANEDIVSKPALFKAAWHDRVPRQQRSQSGGRAREDGEDRFRHDQGRRAQRAAAHARRRHRAHRRAPHPEHALVRRGLAQHGIDGAQRRPRARRRDTRGAGDAQVRPHGEQPR